MDLPPLRPGDNLRAAEGRAAAPESRRRRRTSGSRRWSRSAALHGACCLLRERSRAFSTFYSTARQSESEPEDGVCKSVFGIVKFLGYPISIKRGVFMPEDGKQRSRVITEGPDRAPSRAMLKGVGFTDQDLARPIIGVANTWIEIGPCNFHLRRLSAKVKEGIRAAGGTPMEFNTVSISDGISMGTEGMKCSLISREVIADSIELVARGNHFDALVCLSGCDKTNPGVVMALAR